MIHGFFLITLRQWSGYKLICLCTISYNVKNTWLTIYLDSFDKHVGKLLTMVKPVTVQNKVWCYWRNEKLLQFCLLEILSLKIELEQRVTGQENFTDFNLMRTYEQEIIVLEYFPNLLRLGNFRTKSLTHLE